MNISLKAMAMDGVMEREITKVMATAQGMAADPKRFCRLISTHLMGMVLVLDTLSEKAMGKEEARLMA